MNAIAERLAFLSRIATKEAGLLEQTSRRLFTGDNGPTPEDTQLYAPGSE